LKRSPPPGSFNTIDEKLTPADASHLADAVAFALLMKMPPTAGGGDNRGRHGFEG
jgi:hypothetical protein